MAAEENAANEQDGRTLAEKLKAGRQAAEELLAARKAALARKTEETTTPAEKQPSSPSEDKSQ
jgi:hypothetical protein